MQYRIEIPTITQAKGAGATEVDSFQKVDGDGLKMKNRDTEGKTPIFDPNRLFLQSFRRLVRVVEGARLESVYTRKGIEGSNPSVSARRLSIAV